MACALVCIALGLHGAGIDVVPANVPAPALSARPARRVALRNFGGFAGPYTRGWRRVGRVSVNLVEVVRSNTVGRLGLFPGQVVWLVVIRDVSIPDLGPPGRPHHDFVGWLGVFVRTDSPRYIVATSF
ncbi:MAG: hypothetical protein AUG91_10300 [Actinobacteria bacterium 13_1_20CM_4_69_9]|nr:MAG: hypothetical protein AUG91_10300 [Actinobacteria bacterium 13_1_20CM_4_69_9]